MKPVRLLIAGSFLTGIALAQCPGLSLPNAQSAPGASAVASVSFCSGAASIVGLQFDLAYDNSTLTLNATAGAALASVGTLYAADVAPGLRRYLIVGSGSGSIADGNLIDLSFSVNAAASDAAYPLLVSNIIGTDPLGQPVALAGQAGTLTVNRNGIFGSLKTVRNAASLLAGPVAPGEVITLPGAGIGSDTSQKPIGAPTATVLGGVTVLFDSTLATLLYAGPGQINAIVPYGVYGKVSTTVQVAHQGHPVASLILPVANAAPGIFTQDGSGVGSGAIFNQDQTINSPSNPAAKGSVVTVFATGAGQTNPPGIDGQIIDGTPPSPLLPVSVQIGGLPAQVVYAAAAPGQVSGLLQVNCVVPPDAPSGSAVPIAIIVNTANSQSGVTIAIQ